MSAPPNTNWDMIHHWEWFRRAAWQPTFRADQLGTGGGSVRAFVELAKTIDADVALDCSCGLGRKTICMAESDLNVLGSDRSPVAVHHARELARQEDCPVSYFESSWAELPRHVPHDVDAIFCDALSWEPQWGGLSAAMVGLFHSLKPGGFLLFLGAGEDSDDAAGPRLVAEEWDEGEQERIEWFHREGATVCIKLKQKQRGTDYIDDRLLFAVHDDGQNRLETTTLRRPCYWGWSHWQELTRMAGFCHLETRTYEGYGTDGGTIQLNVAWKSGEGRIEVDEQSRRSPYLE